MKKIILRIDGKIHLSSFFLYKNKKNQGRITQVLSDVRKSPVIISGPKEKLPQNVDENVSVLEIIKD